MGYVDNDVCQARLVVNRIDTGIPEDHECRTIKNWIKTEFSYADEAAFKTRGRPAYRITDLLGAVVYAYKNGVTSGAKISEYCKYHIIYRYMCNGIQPDERTIQYFISNNHQLIQEVFKSTVKMAEKEELTHYEHVSTDGTPVKAYNSPYNILKLKDIEILLEILENNYNKDEINEKYPKLRKSAYKLLKNTNKTNYEKIELLHNLKNRLETSKQSSIALNDSECKWMQNKKKQPQLSYNMQQSVDTDSKIIVAVDVNDQPTDHYQLVKQIDNIEKNLDKVPEYISADTIYRTKENIKKAEEKGIKLLTPTRRQNKKQKKDLNENPYHKDHFQYNYKNNTYKCPENHELELRSITHVKNDPEKLKLHYYTNKCTKCKHKQECTKSNLRVIQDTTYKGELNLRLRMETPEAQELYEKRGHTAEPPFGVLKQQYNLDKIPVTGTENMKSRITLMAIGYNLTVISNRKNKRNNKDTLKNFSKFLLQNTRNFTYSLIFS